MLSWSSRSNSGGYLRDYSPQWTPFFSPFPVVTQSAGSTGAVVTYVAVNTQCTNSWYRVTSCLENLEMSGNLTAVREMSGILLKVREMSGKNHVREKLPKTVYCKLHICIHSWLCWTCAFHFGFGSYWIMHCCIPSPTTDNNTSTGMIWVTLNMVRSAVNRQGNVMELSGNFTLSGERSPCWFCMKCTKWCWMLSCYLWKDGMEWRRYV